MEKGTVFDLKYILSSKIFFSLYEY